MTARWSWTLLLTSGLGLGSVVSVAAQTRPLSLDEALRGVHTAYYLVHLMSGSKDFEREDRQAATNFAGAAKQCGVRRLVYLGGLVPDSGVASAHLASRLEVEQTLLEAAPEALALRASIVVGARSRSFRFLVRVVERVPVMPRPAWRERSDP